MDTRILSLINVNHFRTYVIEAALNYIGLYSQAATELLLGTAVQESRLQYMKQFQGPALGFFQVEPFTLNDIYQNFLDFSNRKLLKERVDKLSSPALTRNGNMIATPCYGAAIARVKYYRDSKPLPKAGDLHGMAAYWKRVYNTPKGAGTEEEFINNYEKYIRGK